MSEMHKAFVTAYADMANPKKNANNPAFRSKYANLEEVLNVTRPLLSACGFALVQEPVSDPDGVGVHTKLMHESGEEIDFGYYTVPLAKHDPQGAGSALTYCKRYALTSIFGLAQEDDDGNAASKPQVKSASKPIPEVDSESQGENEGSELATAAQVRKIWAEAGKMEPDRDKSEQAVKLVCSHDYGVEGPTHLTRSQANAVIDRLVRKNALSKDTAADVAGHLEAMGAKVVQS